MGRRKKTFLDSRSRSGCLPCRKRHRKCGEEQPQCLTCRRRGMNCEYPEIKFRWSGIKGIDNWPSLSQSASVTEVQADFPTPGEIQESLQIPHADRASSPQIDCSSNHDSSQLSGDQSSDCPLEDGYEASCSPDYVAHTRVSGGDAVESPGTLQLWTLDESIFANAFFYWSLKPGEAIALTYYVKHVSGVIPAHDAPGNPYRQLAFLALEAPVLLHTVLSVATSHMYNQGGLSNVTLSTTRQARALASLRETTASVMGIETRSCRTETEAVVAAILLQIFYLALTGGSEVEPHFTCALFLLKELDYLQKPCAGYFSRMIVQRFAMIDVARAIYRRTRPLSPAKFWLYKSDCDFDESEPLFNDMAGYARPILAFLVRTTTLACDAFDDPESWTVAEQASQLETDMHVYWSSTVADRSDALCKAFYWMTHLLIQRRVYGEPTSSRRVQLCVRTIFHLIEHIPPNSGSDSSVFLPFNIAAREVLCEERRGWIRNKSITLSRAYRYATNDDCMELIERIWQCIDNDRSQASTRPLEDKILSIEAGSQCFAF